MADRLTLRDVAREAGVSVATASQALRNHSDTARATCERVQAVAARLGYRPDPVLASLGARRFQRRRKDEMTPVVLVTNNTWSRRQAAIRYEDSLRARLDGLGYAFRRETVDSLSDLRQRLRRWYFEGVRGLVFATFTHPEWLREIDLADFSCVYLGGRCDPPYLHLVKADPAQGMDMAIAELRRRVDGRIGVLLHRHTPEIADDVIREGVARLRLGRLTAEEAAPLHVEEFEGDYDAELERVREWQARYPCEGVVGFNAALHRLEACGWVRPGRVFIALMADQPGAWPAVIEPQEREATRAVELLDSMIRYGEKGVPENPLQVLISPVWHAAGNTVNLPGAVARGGAPGSDAPEGEGTGGS